MKRYKMSSETWERIRESRNAAAKRRRVRLKEQGLCIVCRQPVTRFVICDECRERYKDNKARQRAERLQRGLCVLCGEKPHRPGVQTCYICGLKDSDRSTRSQQKRKGIENADI